MSEPEQTVQFQVPIRKRTRTRLKSMAANHETTMATLADVFLEYCVSLYDSGAKVPPVLAAAVEKAIAAERERKAKDDADD